MPTALKKEAPLVEAKGILTQFGANIIHENLDFKVRRGEIVGLVGGSGGMKKRAGLARALALDPSLLYLDEPTAGLDPIGASAFDQLILGLREAMDLTVIMVTHDLDSLFTICDRVAVLVDKRIAINDSLPKVREFDHPWVQEYFGGARARAANSAGNTSEQDFGSA